MPMILKGATFLPLEISNLVLLSFWEKKGVEIHFSLSVVDNIPLLSKHSAFIRKKDNTPLFKQAQCFDQEHLQCFEI